MGLRSGADDQYSERRKPRRLNRQQNKQTTIRTRATETLRLRTTLAALYPTYNRTTTPFPRNSNQLCPAEHLVGLNLPAILKTNMPGGQNKKTRQACWRTQCKRSQKKTTHQLTPEGPAALEVISEDNVPSKSKVSKKYRNMIKAK